ncbi:hypothetical protein KKI24_16620, partial [bacterium]|nr:hypothetical protein [bacterium]
FSKLTRRGRHSHQVTQRPVMVNLSLNSFSMAIHGHLPRAVAEASFLEAFTTPNPFNNRPSMTSVN